MVMRGLLFSRNNMSFDRVFGNRPLPYSTACCAFFSFAVSIAILPDCISLISRMLLAIR